MPEELDCAIVIGGDGSLIEVARLLWSRDVPIIGINMGTLGYLTEIELSHLDDALDQINSLDASYVSTQSILQREIAQNYTTAAQSYNTMASGFPANVIGTLWGAGQVELYAAQ